MEDDDDEGLIWKALVKTGLVLAIVALVTGFLGWLHPLGDSIAVGRAYAVAAVLLLAIAASLMGMRVAAFWSILLAMVAGTPVILSQTWPGPSGQLVLYQKNLHFDNPDLPGLEADIRLTDPVALTLQEVSEPNLALLGALKDVLPYQHVCSQPGVGGPAIATRLPPVEGAVLCAPGLAAMQVIWADSQGQRPVWLVSVHLLWPWPYNQSDHAAELARVLAGLEGSVVMAGDFNMVRWGHTVRLLAAASRTVAAGPARASYVGLGPLLQMPIDHAFAPSGGRIEMRGTHGSDHRGLLTFLEP